jgi:sporulation-control protein
VVFKRLKQAFGVGGPQLDTVLSNPNTRPGLGLEGVVNITGGEHPVDIKYIALGLVTKVEVETQDSEYDSTVEFSRLQVTGAFQIGPGQPMQIPFQFPVPWETPITDVFGQRMHGMTMGLRTELEVARALDKGDLDPVNVHPLPIHEAILDGFARVGFRFKGADLERGRLHGVHQTLPFYQEIEFYAAPQYKSKINEAEATFVTSPQGVEVVLEFDKKGGLFTEGRDVTGRYQVSHHDVGRVDWAAVVDGWVQEALRKRHGLFH